MSIRRLFAYATLSACLIGGYKYLSHDADKSQIAADQSPKGYTLITDIHKIVGHGSDATSPLDLKLGPKKIYVAITDTASFDNNKSEDNNGFPVKNTGQCVAIFILHTIGEKAADTMHTIMKGKAKAHIKSQLFCFDLSGDDDVIIAGTFDTDCTQNNGIVTCNKAKPKFYVKTKLVP